ncbi:unnamed protein product [Allacma fusca]|uniref:Uncharacterized protein n=1 Tax=Allacma fusca TaxID=39272 RepID=A0A8J2JQB1_9HEXA|nr:unnamed protein product [Allacma fusca]
MQRLTRSQDYLKPDLILRATIIYFRKTRFGTGCTKWEQRNCEGTPPEYEAMSQTTLENINDIISTVDDRLLMAVCQLAGLEKMNCFRNLLRETLPDIFICVGD